MQRSGITDMERDSGRCGRGWVAPPYPGGGMGRHGTAKGAHVARHGEGREGDQGDGEPRVRAKTQSLETRDRCSPGGDISLARMEGKGHMPYGYYARWR